MAKFTREELRSILGDAHTEEIENRLIALYLGATDPMKDEIQALRAAAARADDLQRQLDAHAQDPDLKAANEALQKQLDDLKAAEARRETLRRVDAAYVDLLKQEHIDEKRIDLILRKDRPALQDEPLDKDGRLVNADKLREAIRADWSGYVVTEDTRPAPTKTPPAPTGAGFEAMNLTQKMAFANEHPNAPEVQAWLNK